MSSIFMFSIFASLLISDTDPKEIHRIEEILKQNKIPYRVQTDDGRGRLGRLRENRTYMSVNMPAYSNAFESRKSYLIYVWKKDLDRAYSLI